MGGENRQVIDIHPTIGAEIHVALRKRPARLLPVEREDSQISRIYNPIVIRIAVEEEEFLHTIASEVGLRV